MSNNKANFIENQKPPIKISLEELVNKEGLEYAHYVLQSRALVEVYGDGLKPVQRRILYAMYKMGSTPTSATIKGARISGEVIGKYHPHGPQSVEGAQALMGQPFATRIPMFKVQGTLGSFTGDEAPSSRYYEIGLNQQSWELVKELSTKSTAMRISEICTESEPIFLPTRMPYLLIQGSTGVAVGYSTNIPPHNPTECIDACIAYFQGKIKSNDDVLKYIKGPDFPTGGQILGIDAIKQYINTGTGTFIIRGKYRIEELPRGRTLVEFYELPYQISVLNIISSIAMRQDKGKLKEVAEVKDLSDDKKGLSCSIYLKSGCNVNKVIDKLFKLTPLQSNFKVNSTALLKGIPTQEIPILQMIQGFCSFRQDCFIQKIKHRLEQSEKELHRYNGLLAILVDIDKAISIIRNAKDADSANKKLQSTFKIDTEQANHILSLQLRKLTKADKNEIIAKSNELKKESDKLQKILVDEKTMKKEIIKELEETKKVIDSPRRTEIIGVTNQELAQQVKDQTKQERLLEKNVECFVYIEKDLSIYKLLEKDPTNTNYYFKTTSKANSYIVTADGELIDVENDLIPVNRDNKINLNQLNKTSSKIVGFVPDFDLCNGLFLLSDTGDGNIVKPPYKANNKLTQLIPGSSLIAALPIYEKDNHSVCIVDTVGKLAKVKLSAIRETRQGAGLIKICSLESPIVGVVISNDKGVLITESKDGIKYTLVEDCPDKGRGGKGYLLHKLKAKDEIISVQFKETFDNETVSSRGSAGHKK